MSSCLILLALIQSAAGQPPERRDSSIVIVPNARYQAGALHRFLFGNTRRELWATPIRVEVLDLASFAGGLEAYEKGGSAQTRSLRFRSKDGRVFVFRSLDKDPTQRFPLPLRHGPPRWLTNDQISAMVPAGALTVGALEQAAGFLPTMRYLVALPDDQRLGKWRPEFQGAVGLLETKPQGHADDPASIPGAVEIVPTDTLFERLRESAANQVDQHRFLEARLFDILVGDWDRHADQWSWVRFDREKRHLWVPLPRDRDWALSRLSGTMYKLARIYHPKWQAFGPKYTTLRGLFVSSEILDRRLLAGLDGPAYDSVARALAAVLTDDVIERAVATLPREFSQQETLKLADALKRRRDALPEAAAHFYRHLAGTVDVRGSNDPEVAVVDRGADGSLMLAISTGPASTPDFRRRFDPAETKEVRIYLYGGADTARIARAGSSSIRFRLVPGGGPNLVVDSTAVDHVKIYDDSGSTRVLAPVPLPVSHAKFRSPVDPDSPVKVFRDWGQSFGVAPWFELHSNIGAVLGAGPVLYRYGFRRVPYQSRIALRLAFATGAPGVNADLKGDFRFENQSRAFKVRLATLDVDVVRFFGFGNEVTRSAEIDFYQGRQHRHVIEPVLELSGRGMTLGVGPVFRSSTSDFSRSTLLAQARPYGSGRFTEAGVATSWTLDSRDQATNPTRGVRLRVTGRWFPSLFDVATSFGSVQLDGSTYLTAKRAPGAPTLALRAGGTRVFGAYPFFEAAAIGGRESVRSLNGQRFIGDGAIFGTAELRLDLASFTGIAPRRLGIHGLYDRGRVYLDGERSNSWHGGPGGGVWFALLERSIVTATYASSGEGTRFYIHGGFHF